MKHLIAILICITILIGGCKKTEAEQQNRTAALPHNDTENNVNVFENIYQILKDGNVNSTDKAFTREKEEKDTMYGAYNGDYVFTVGGYDESLLPEGLQEALSEALLTGELEKFMKSRKSSYQILTEEEIKMYRDENSEKILESLYLDNHDPEQLIWYLVTLEGEDEDIVVRKPYDTKGEYVYYFFPGHKHGNETFFELCKATRGIGEEHYFMEWKGKNYLAIPEWNEKKDTIKGIAVYLFDDNVDLGTIMYLELNRDGTIMISYHSYNSIGTGRNAGTIWPGFQYGQQE